MLRTSLPIAALLATTLLTGSGMAQPLLAATGLALTGGAAASEPPPSPLADTAASPSSGDNPAGPSGGSPDSAPGPARTANGPGGASDAPPLLPPFSGPAVTPSPTETTAPLPPGISPQAPPAGPAPEFPDGPPQNPSSAAPPAIPSASDIDMESLTPAAGQPAAKPAAAGSPLPAKAGKAAALKAAAGQAAIVSTRPVVQTHPAQTGPGLAAAAPKAPAQPAAPAPQPRPSMGNPFTGAPATIPEPPPLPPQLAQPISPAADSKAEAAQESAVPDVAAREETAQAARAAEERRKVLAEKKRRDAAAQAEAGTFYTAQIQAVENRQGAQSEEIRRERAYPWLDKSYRAAGKGDRQAAAQAIETYLAHDPGALVLRYRAMVEEQSAGRNEAAIALASDLLQKMPGLGVALFYRAMAATTLAGEVRDSREAAGIRDAASADFLAAFSATTYPLTRYDQERALGAAFEAAIGARDAKQARKLAAMGEDMPAAIPENANERIAAILDSGDAAQKAEAAALYRQIADAAHTSAELAANMRKSGLEWQKAGNPAKALEAFRIAADVVPDHDNIASVLAMAQDPRAGLSPRARVALADHLLTLSPDAQNDAALMAMRCDGIASADRLAYPRCVETALTPPHDAALSKAARIAYMQELAAYYVGHGEPRAAQAELESLARLGVPETPAREAQLAQLYYQQHDYIRAELLYRALAQKSPSAHSYLMLGVIAQQGGRNGIAIAMLERARALDEAAPAALAPPAHNRRARHGRRAQQDSAAPASGETRASGALGQSSRHLLYSTLGYAYAEAIRPDDADAAWARAQSLSDDPADRALLALKRAQMQMLAGRPRAALDLLTAVDSVALPDAAAQADYFQTRADAARGVGDLAQARDFAGRAVALAPSADRYKQLGEIARAQGDLAGANDAFAKANAERRNDPVLLSALAYVQADRGDYAEAAANFEQAVRVDPYMLNAQQDEVYAYVHAHENSEASLAINRAIDSWPQHELGIALAPDPAAAQTASDEQLFGLREQQEELARRFTFTAFSNPCFGGSANCSNLFSNGGRASTGEGGLQAAYQPAGWGYDDGRIFQVYARLFWAQPNNLPTPTIDTGTFGIGARYKPLRDENLFVALEELFKLGNDGVNDTLLRISYSSNFSGRDELLDQGVPFREWYLYRGVYGEFDQYMQSGQSSLYGDARLGLTTPLGERQKLSPFAYLTAYGTWQDSSSTNERVVTSGIGLSYRYYFDEDMYTAPRDAIELSPRIGHDIADANGPASWRYTLNMTGQF